MESLKSQIKYKSQYVSFVKTIYNTIIYILVLVVNKKYGLLRKHKNNMNSRFMPINNCARILYTLFTKSQEGDGKKDREVGKTGHRCENQLMSIQSIIH